MWHLIYICGDLMAYDVDLLHISAHHPCPCSDDSSNLWPFLTGSFTIIFWVQSWTVCSSLCLTVSLLSGCQTQAAAETVWLLSIRPGVIYTRLSRPWDEDLKKWFKTSNVKYFHKIDNVLVAFSVNIKNKKMFLLPFDPWVRTQLAGSGKLGAVFITNLN